MEVKMVKPKGYNRRRNYFIKKEFQLRFILRFCLLVVLTAFISSAVIYYFSSQSVTTVFEDSRIEIKPSTEFIMPGLLLSIFISVILVGSATIAVVMFLTHRIAGPLYKIEKSLERVSKGDLSFEVAFRSNDEMIKLAESFNMATGGLNGLLKDLKADLGRVEAALDRLKSAASKEDGRLSEIAQETESARRALEKSLNKFILK